MKHEKMTENRGECESSGDYANHLVEMFARNQSVESLEQYLLILGKISCSSTILDTQK